MITPEYEYHIYAKDNCLYHSLKENEFKEKWKEIKAMVGLMKTDYSEDDLQYEKVSSGTKGTMWGGSSCPPGEDSY